MNPRWLFNALSPAGPSARLSVLIFHRVRPVSDPLFPQEPDAARFETEMRWVQSWFHVLPLPEAVERLRAGTLPARAAAITFDDGYADNCTEAMPILRRLGLPATFFIATGYLDGGRMWNDTVIEAVRVATGAVLDLTSINLGTHAVATIENRRTAVAQLLGALKYREPMERIQLADEIAAIVNVLLPGNLMMSTGQVRIMADVGMTIGAHTVTHPILTRMPEVQAFAEMADSKRHLEGITGREVTLFAYPNGKPQTDYAGTHAALARQAGFAAAVSTGWGAAASGSDLYQIPRFTPWDRAKWRYALRLARNLREVAIVAH